MGWWEFEAGDLKHPGYFRERSALWRAGVLSDDEKAFLERDWRREFDAAREKDARERREHYEHHDIPAELVARWKGESRRRSRAAEAPEKAAPDVASGVEGEAKGVACQWPESSAAAEILKERPRHPWVDDGGANPKSTSHETASTIPRRPSRGNI